MLCELLLLKVSACTSETRETRTKLNTLYFIKEDRYRVELRGHWLDSQNRLSLDKAWKAIFIVR